MNIAKDISLQIIENVVSRAMHDIIGPLTAVMNSISILSLRKENEKISNNPKFPNSKLLEIADGSIHEILNRVFINKCLYSLSNENFKISVEEFSKNWNMILTKNNIKLEFNSNLSEIWNYEAQIISHIVYIIIENFSTKNNIIVDKIEDKVLISCIDIPSEVIEFIYQTEEEINVVNINLHFLKLLLQKSGCKIESKEKGIFIEKFFP